MRLLPLYALCFGMLACTSGSETSTENDNGSSILSVIGESNDSLEVEEVFAQVERQGGDPSGLKRQAGAVGKITIGGGSGVATGFLITPDIVATNSHVVQSVKEADPTGRIDWYDRDHVTGMTFDPSYTRSGTSAPVAVKEVILSHQANDVAFLRLQAPLDNVPTLSLDTNPTIGTSVYVIGHPAGEYKQFAYYQKTTDANGETTYAEAKSSNTSDWERNDALAPNAYYDSKYEHAIIHTADTKGGSSGSPLIEAGTGKVIGVHFSGFASGHAPFKGEYNAAISMKAIAATVTQNREALPADLLALFGLNQ